jgi:hypothetical protein
MHRQKKVAGCEQYAIPETNGRQSSMLNFNKSNDDLWIHIFTKSGVHNIEVFTLFGEWSSSIVSYCAFS